MGYRDMLDADRRLVILRAVNAEHDGKLSEALLQQHLDRYGHNIARDLVRTLIRSLEALGAVIVHEPAPDTMIAEITQTGEDHMARRARIEGIAVPSRTRA